MTTLREAAQQALEVINDTAYGAPVFRQEVRDTITTLRAALAQQAEPVEPVEPVAWLQPKTVDAHTRPDLGYETCSKTDYGAFSVYTAPPQRKPLPLKTVEKLIYENTKISPNVADDRELLGYIVNAVRAVERAHGIKE